MFNLNFKYKLFGIMAFLTILMPFQNCAKQGSSSDTTSTSVSDNSSTELIPSNTAVNTAANHQHNSDQTNNNQSNSTNNNTSNTTNNTTNNNSNNNTNNNSNNDTSTEGAPIPTIELFTILPGTSNKSWNTNKTPMVVYVGQTLKITNNDSIAHRLHTTGNPCPHQTKDMAPNGGTYDCVISSDTTKAATATMVDYPLYDHSNKAAKFYLRVYDGPKIYEQKKCSSCHGNLSTSEVRGNDVTNINSALKNIARMQKANIVLTPQEIEALEIALRN